MKRARNRLGFRLYFDLQYCMLSFRVIGCDSSSSGSGSAQGRSEVVQATGSMANRCTVGARHRTLAAPNAPRVSVWRAIEPARTLPRGTLPHVEAPGAASTGDHVPTGDGRVDVAEFFRWMVWPLQRRNSASARLGDEARARRRCRRISFSSRWTTTNGSSRIFSRNNLPRA